MVPILRKILFGTALGLIAVPCLTLPGLNTLYAQSESKVLVWMTDPAANVLFQQQAEGRFEKGGDNSSGTVIAVDEKKSFQSIDGFGWALTDGSAQHIIAMSPDSRAALLQDLFRTDGTHIGGSYLRVSIGASDLSDHVYSYDDLPAGQTDTSMEHFDLGPQKKDVVPVLKEILQI
ncbi:MAG TPA: hypothetical protein VNU72_10565, partial [Puia sp.]|nr:hypothetical protein [Puia sp.]